MSASTASDIARVSSIPGPYRADWRTYANCLALDVNDFFPEKGGSGAVRVVRAICGACEVREQCLDFAIEQGIWDGIWGGLTPNERRTVVRARKAVA